MKSTLTLVLLLLSLTHAKADFGVKLMAAGDEHTCAVADGDLKCWGLYNQLAPPLTNIRLLSAGLYHTCAVADQGLKCWGNIPRNICSYRGEYCWETNTNGQLDFPPLTNVRLLSAGLYHTCAVADQGLKCWGNNEFGQLNAPSLTNIRLLSAGESHTCAVGDQGLKCWGWNRGGQLDAPPLTNIRLLSTGGDHTCAVGDQGLKCWGWNRSGQLDAPPLTNIRLLSAGGDHTCAVGDQGLKCWGWSKDSGLNPPPLTNIRLLSAGDHHTCAVADEGIKCWGWYDWAGNLDVPESISPRYSFFPKLDNGLIASSKVSYPYKRTFFENTAKMVAYVPDNASTSATYLPGLQNAFILNAIAPVIESTDSAVFKNNVIPGYSKSQSEMNERFELTSLSDIELRASVLRAALQLSANALTACRDYVAENEARESLETFLSQIAGLIAENPNPSGMASATAINKAQILFETHSALIQKLSNEKRTRGFGLMLLEISHYLSGDNR